MTLALVVAVFSILVLVHELGHFLAARRNGIKVDEFGLGFPPRILGRQIGETLYTLNLLPLGGFVKLQGEDSADSRPGSFGVASLGAKARVLLAGVAMNLALAYGILLALALTGLPPILPNQFSYGSAAYSQPPQVLAGGIQPGSPAAAAGIKPGETVVSGDGRGFASARDLTDFTKAKAGEKVSLVVRGQDGNREVALTLRPPASKEGFLGVIPFETYKLRYGWSAPVVAAGILWQLVAGTLGAFGGLIAGLLKSGQVSDQVAGPVGIASLLGSVAQLGLSYLAVMVAAISVSLAVMNSLPVPALDGGRLALLLGQKLSGKSLTPRAEAAIHAAGFIALILLMVAVTYFDLQRLR